MQGKKKKRRTLATRLLAQFCQVDVNEASQKKKIKKIKEHPQIYAPLQDFTLKTTSITQMADYSRTSYTKLLLVS